MLDSLLTLDGAVFTWLGAVFHPGANSFFDAFFLFCTHLGDNGLFWMIAAALLLIPKRTRKIGVVMFGALLLGIVLNNGLLKHLFHRPRPFAQELDWWQELYTSIFPTGPLIPVHTVGDSSFPSGHTAGAFAPVFAFLFAGRRYWKPLTLRIFIPACILAVLVAFSRLYIGVHHFTDIFVAAFVGVGCAALSAFLYQKVDPLFSRKLPKLF